MLQLAITCLVIALIAALLGFGGIAGSFVGVAKILFVVFLVLAVLSFLGGGLREGVTGGKRETRFPVPRWRSRSNPRQWPARHFGQLVQSRRCHPNGP